MNNTKENNPKCENPKCENYVTEHLIRRGKPTKKWKKCCSIECQNFLKFYKARQTMIAKYGTDNSMHMEETKQKIKNTNLERYGVENPSQLQDVKEKMKSTMLERYGVTHQMHMEETKQKIKNTNLERYGVENPSQNDQIKDKKQETCFSNFGVYYPQQSEAIREKLKNNNIEKYGVPHISYINIGKERMEYLNDEQWCKDFIKEHDIETFSEYLNISKQTALKYLKKYDLIEITNSLFEQEMKYFLKTLNVDFKERTRQIIPPLELDFVINDIAIECNGTYWHSEQMGKDKNYHINKTNHAKQKGYHLIHVWEHIWNKNPNLVKSRIKSKLGYNDIIYARKTEIKEISSQETNSFLEKNHIQGKCPSSIQYGLYHEYSLVAVMTFGKSRFNKNYEYELLRYCSLQNINVIGGASKLLACFKKNINPKSIITYSDKSWNTGLLYEKMGFVYLHTSSPSYQYVKNGTAVYSRIKYQKHKLKELLPIFDEKLSEWENMKNNGYDRIWDCGTDVYVWKST